MPKGTNSQGNHYSTGDGTNSLSSQGRTITSYDCQWHSMIIV